MTTLHTNNASSAVTRLVDMGAEPFLVASSMTLVVAQRLVRLPCAHCSQPYNPPAELLKHLGVDRGFLDGATPRRGVGCTECNETGYRGRVGIFEVLATTPEIRETIVKTPTESAVSRTAAAEGIVTLRQAGLLKAFRGQTTFEEVLRVT
jgi:type IV pilus assembly protein PilB